MEASEKPQLQFDDHGSGTVRALGDRLVISELTVEDERAARVVRERMEEGEKPSTTVIRAIEIGTRVMEVEGTAADAEFVRRELQGGIGQLNEKLGSTLSEGAEAIAEQIAEQFGADSNKSVQGQIREIVTRGTHDQMQGLVKLLTAENGENPLVAAQMRMNKVVAESEERHRGEIQRLREGHTKEAHVMQARIGALTERIAQLLERTEGDQRLAEEAEKGTAKGRTFEELVHATIEDVAAGYDDAAHHTGDATSDAGGKKGDTVVEIGAGLGSPVATVVFEAKNKKLSKNDAWTELNACMAERDAVYSVLVVAGEDKVPSGLDELTEYQGNKIIAVLDREDPDPLALRLIYRYVRARVLASSDSALEVDAAGVRDAAEEATARLKRANRVRKSLTNVTTSADAARSEFDEMLIDVERCLARIESLVAAATQVGSAATQAEAA